MAVCPYKPKHELKYSPHSIGHFTTTKCPPFRKKLPGIRTSSEKVSRTKASNSSCTSSARFPPKDQMYENAKTRTILAFTASSGWDKSIGVLPDTIDWKNMVSDVTKLLSIDGTYSLPWGARKIWMLLCLWRCAMVTKVQVQTITGNGNFSPAFISQRKARDAGLRIASLSRPID